VDPRLISAVRTTFAEVFPGALPQVAFAPGRVNLIGEHTDYNEGHVFPMAIARGVAVAFRPRRDRLIRAHSIQVGTTRELTLDALETTPRNDWTAYVAGVAWAFPLGGEGLPGLDLVVAADLPMGAGLSSSAALEVAIARAFAASAGTKWEPEAAAKLCQKAEDEFVGIHCGLMDQFASAMSLEGCALLLDCRSLRSEPIPLPAAANVVVMDTGVRRRLATSAYNERRAACDSAVAAVRELDESVRALRDVNRPLLESARARMSDLVFRRAAHVVDENDRPRALAAAFREGNLGAAGRLMDDSHTSLRDLYEVSCPELDLLTDLARGHPACHGARMTGAGFGGCAIALVKHDGAHDFARRIAADYGQRTGLPTWAWVCGAEEGARLLG
jgi:galactokinase